MLRPLLRLVAPVLVLVAVLAGALAPAAPASAHNSFQSSDPADGAVLTAPPAQISMVFAREVPLETATVTLTDATGARSELGPLIHGPAGDNELVAPLPPLSAGDVSVRWRLVGPDGHPLSGRVEFVVATPATIAPSTAPAAPAVAATAPPAATTSPATARPPVDMSGHDAGVSTPAALRWVLRYGSYVAIMIVVGVVLTDRLVWPGVASRPAFRSAVARSLIAVTVLGLGQLLVLASDIAGRAPWASLGTLDAAVGTPSGLAMVIRAVVAFGLWVVMFRLDVADSEVRWAGVSMAGLVLLGTWAWAGHSSTQRWPELGIPLDVVHHAAAGVWIGGLAIVGWHATRHLDATALPRVMVRLSRVAAASVALVVATGLLQALRLVGSPWRLFDADHGIYLAVKLGLVAAMLAVANVNRRRVNADIAGPERVDPGLVARLRQSILIEFGVGLAIIAITAAMVVSPPATANAPSSDVAVAQP